MHIEVSTFSPKTALALCMALEKVLDSRLHRRIYLGDEVLVSGSLSKALKIPYIIKLLKSSHAERQIKGVMLLTDLWTTLSQETQKRTLDNLGWYEPKDLPWDDPRSNRQPKIDEIN